ncbi:GNAT family N-acetyltransferase [Agrobacterium sp. DKPNP3]|uniref:GNAT family N-acetyltransferase n=1 Tax=Agrobacterium sp. DKPNP3 TaxID=3457323 RepID=UPI0040451412
MIIRPAEPRDLPDLRNLFLRSRRAAFFWEVPSTFVLEDFDTETNGEAITISADNDRLTGFISVWQPSNFIHHLHVDPRYVGRGIGRSLLSSLPGWKSVRYQLKCVSANRGALAFYLANGFVEVGQGKAGNHEYRLLETAIGTGSMEASKAG